MKRRGNPLSALKTQELVNEQMNKANKRRQMLSAEAARIRREQREETIPVDEAYSGMMIGLSSGGRRNQFAGMTRALAGIPLAEHETEYYKT